MGRLLIVSKRDGLSEYQRISEEYQVSYEINDFFEPDILEDEKKINEIIEDYLKAGIPSESTLHGAFYDLAVFSPDAKIREISELRMRQSMEIAERLGVKGVVFHTNINPALENACYSKNAIDKTAEYLEKLLLDFPKLQIYLENMFDAGPEVLYEISGKLKKYPNYGVCLDYAHASISKTDPEIWMDILLPFMKHIHINDNHLITDEHLPLGRGKIGWNRFFMTYVEQLSDCSLLIETTDPKDQEESLLFLKEHYPRVLEGRIK